MLPSRKYEPPPEMVADIRARLAGVCKGYSDSEFAALVWEIAYLRAKYERVTTEGFFLSARELAAELRSRQQLRGTPPRAD